MVLLYLVALSTATAELDSVENAKWEQEQAVKRAENSAAFSHLMAGVDSLEVILLDPAARNEGAATERVAEGRLDGWKIVQRVRINKRSEIEQLATGLRLSTETSPSGVALCFEPRHALRFTKEGKEVFVIVCFRCAYMEVKGYAPFQGASVSRAAEKDFYLVFRAHGLTRPNRLAGMSDREVTKRLIGKWSNKRRQAAGRTGGLELAFEEVEVFAADGAYQSNEKISFVKKDEKPEPFREISQTGRWHVEDGMLILSGLYFGPVAASGSYEVWTPIMEISPARYARASLMPDSDKEELNERISEEDTRQ
jgi:hypothetical protein